MTAYTAGQFVPNGVYLSLRRADVHVISGGETKLQGLQGVLYHRLPLVAFVALVPVLGGLFAMSFPFVIFAAFAKAVGEWIWQSRTYRTGEAVRWGVYLGVSRPAVACVTQTGDALQSKADARFIRLPTTLVVLMSPLLGLLYVLFLPAIMAVVLVGFIAAVVVAKRAGKELPKGPWSHESLAK